MLSGTCGRGWLCLGEGNDGTACVYLCLSYENGHDVPAWQWWPCGRLDLEQAPHEGEKVGTKVHSGAVV